MKHIGYYMNLPYTIVMRRDDDGDFVVRIEELPGCSSHGARPDEALENLKEAQRLWIEDCLDAGQPVPEPAPDEALPSGKWVQRVPRTLHQKLVRLAEREGVSLNQLASSILAEATGTLSPAKPREPVPKVIRRRHPGKKSAA
jgi:predicted RNase H-like HicB family nuclease